MGSYFKTGSNGAVSLLADPRYTRAWPGGVGNRKMGSNYAPTINVQKEAAARGLQQVLWLYGEDHQLTEVGTMNIFMFYVNEQGGELKPTQNSVLQHLTRGSSALALSMTRGCLGIPHPNLLLSPTSMTRGRLGKLLSNFVLLHITFCTFTLIRFPTLKYCLNSTKLYLVVIEMDSRR